MVRSSILRGRFRAAQPSRGAPPSSSIGGKAGRDFDDSLWLLPPRRRGCFFDGPPAPSNPVEARLIDAPLAAQSSASLCILVVVSAGDAIPVSNCQLGEFMPLQRV